MAISANTLISGIPNANPGIAWVARPSASTAGAGAIIRVSDLGPGGSSWISDGTIWRPLAGHAMLYQRVGSVATPIATLSGDGTAKSFVLPENVLIPANTLFVGATLLISARFRRIALAGAPVAANCTTRFGSTNTTADGSVGSVQVAAAVGQEYESEATLQVYSSTVSVGRGFVAANAVQQNTFSDRTVNITVDNYLSCGVAAGYIAGDTVALISYSVALKG